MAASRQTWPITKPDSCLTATIDRLDLHDLPDHPYHPDTKVVFRKRDFQFGVTMLASLWRRYQLHTLCFPLQLPPTYCTWSCDVTSRTSIFHPNHLWSRGAGTVYVKHQSANMKHKSVRWTMLTSWVSMSWPRSWSCWNGQIWRVNISTIWRIERPGKAPILLLTRLCSRWLNVWSLCLHFNMIQVLFPEQIVSNPD